MPTSLRPLLALLLAGAMALAVAACGGADAASSDTSVDALLDETFASENRVDSARLDLALGVTPQGAGADGSLSLRLTGPFQSEGDRRLPRFALDLAAEGAGQRVRAGATSTGEKGFVRFQGRDYVVSDVLFRQLRAGFEEAQAEGQGGGQGLAGLGIDPRAWLRDPINAGEADVGGEATVKVTGGVDVPRMLADVDRALERAGRLGLHDAGKLPERLTEAQKREIAESVSDPRVEVYTGAEDRILRRLVVTSGVRDADDPAESAAVRLDLTLADVNQDQEITAPANARPLEELLGAFGGLGGLGAGSGAAGAGDREALERYTTCVTEAGSDEAAARRCADLLTP